MLMLYIITGVVFMLLPWTFRCEMLNHLIHRAAKWHASLDAETAAFLPRIALYPAHVAKYAAIAPALHVSVNGKREFPRAANADFELKRLHNRNYSPGGSTPNASVGEKPAGSNSVCGLILAETRSPQNPRQQSRWNQHKKTCTNRHGAN